VSPTRGGKTLDGLWGKDHPESRAAWPRELRPRSAVREVIGVPMARRGAEAEARRRCLALWFAVLLAITPFARLSLPVALLPAPASADFASPVRDHAVAPVPRVRPAPPFDLGVLVRWSQLETKPGLSSSPPATDRPGVAGRPLAGPSAAGAQDGTPRDLFHLSSVGTARRPTGPPAPASAFA
jgi:hypothetical protein